MICLRFSVFAFHNEIKDRSGALAEGFVPPSRQTDDLESKALAVLTRSCRSDGTQQNCCETNELEYTPSSSNSFLSRSRKYITTTKMLGPGQISNIPRILCICFQNLWKLIHIFFGILHQENMKRGIHTPCVK